jgi:hypothetical protein
MNQNRNNFDYSDVTILGMEVNFRNYFALEKLRNTALNEDTYVIIEIGTPPNSIFNLISNS